MVEQAPINRFNGFKWESDSHGNQDPENQHMGGLKQLLADISELGELQARLVADDVRKSFTATIQPSVFAILSIAVLLGTVPILLLGISSLLVEKLEWTPYAAQLTCGGSALALAMALGCLAMMKFRRCANPLQRSMNELEKNLETLRLMLGKKGQTASDHQI